MTKVLATLVDYLDPTARQRGWVAVWQVLYCVLIIIASVGLFLWGLLS